MCRTNQTKTRARKTERLRLQVQNRALRDGVKQDKKIKQPEKSTTVPSDRYGEEYREEVVKHQALCVAMASYLRHGHTGFGEVAQATSQNIAMLLEEVVPSAGKERNEETTPVAWRWIFLQLQETTQGGQRR